MKPNRSLAGWLPCLSALVVLTACTLTLNAQVPKGKEVGISLYPGVTLLNYEKALDYPDEYMEDWSDFHFSFALRGFLMNRKPLQLGAELAMQQLYYAYYIIPYVPNPVYREFSVSTVSATVLLRYMKWNWFAVGGIGLHVFGNGVAPSVCLEAGYNFQPAKRISFPVSLRINPIFGAGLPVPVSIGAGVTYLFR